jgi:hypothetical protein
MRVGEVDKVGFRFQGADLPAGVTVVSGTVAVSPSSGLTPGSETALVTPDSDGVYAWVTAVTAGTYDVMFTIVFSDTPRALKRVYRVIVQ